MDSGERKFLHDMASPVGSAIFVLDMMLDKMKGSPSTDPEDLRQTLQVYALMEKMKLAIEARREILVKRGDPGSKGP